jgi:hypothetical protein
MPRHRPEPDAALGTALQRFASATQDSQNRPAKGVRAGFEWVLKGNSGTRHVACRSEAEAPKNKPALLPEQTREGHKRNR